MTVTKNDAGFRGRQWESDVTGQQYATQRDALAGEEERRRDLTYLHSPEFRADVNRYQSMLEDAGFYDGTGPFEDEPAASDTRSCGCPVEYHMGDCPITAPYPDGIFDGVDDDYQPDYDGDD